uniref:Fibronectin type-III domain-containing protein n=1 Tax=Magallana gigas TaxID=29159 RepID=A0A8W8KQQ6_MAGGI
MISLFIVLLRLTLIRCNSDSDFSSSVNVWIDRCTLHINYTRPAGNGSCLPRSYRVIIVYSEHDKITQTDTDILKYSYYDINSTSQYTVKVQPAFSCNVFGSTSTLFGDFSETKILALAGFYNQTVTANESTNVSINFPVQEGAYGTNNFIKWSHTVGENNVVVRNFTTTTVELVNVKFEDSGTYFYTAEYRGCGFEAANLFQGKGFVQVNFHGSPIISAVKRAIDGHAENSSTYLMNVISLPKAPRSGIMIEYKNGSKLKINCSKVVPAAFPYYMHGKVLDVNGYQMSFEIEKVTVKWLNEFTVYVDNDFGEHGFKVVLEESKLKLNTFDIESFINMNTAAVFGLSGGVVLFVVITSGVVICCIRKKRNATCKLQKTESSEAQGDKTSQVVSRIYSPYEAPNQDDDCTYNEYNEKRIERERQQIASTYSFGGFSLGEFHEEDTTYNNDPYSTINQKNCVVAMNQ